MPGRNRQGSGRGGSQGGRGRKGGLFKAGPEGNCLCPKCGHKEPHQRGKPCISKKCTQCGTQMVRE